MDTFFQVVGIVTIGFIAVFLILIGAGVINVGVERKGDSRD